MKQPEESQSPQPAKGSPQHFLNWFHTPAGKVTFGPRPDIALLEEFHVQGVSHVASFQTSEEDVLTLKQQCRAQNIEWVWLPIVHLQESSQAEIAMLQQYVAELRQILTKGGHIYLHCDESGLRCHLMFIALCHHLGMPSASSYSALHDLSGGDTSTLSRHNFAWAADLGGSVQYQF
ncbi:protein-tyrosine phosphatase family protein [Salinimonas chungwhensis]|uniref:hypothetical protein n=1 Tax=Salinimonas chungwhensis TaxID=265425 RepID=UPI0003AB3153|nr:hypothetical protein [Salinimonas chungwhensis]